jgi:hypothetical protein
MSEALNKLSVKTEHLDEIRNAKKLLENSSLAVQLINVIGKPIEISLYKLPKKLKEPINKAVQTSIEKALNYLTFTFNKKIKAVKPLTYKVASAGTGFSGGFFGIAGLSLELPVTTLIMLRSILQIAAENGEDIKDLKTRIACLEVFALGGTSPKDNAAETGYYAVRMGMTGIMKEAAKHLTQKGLAGKGGSVLVRLITSISSRFGIVVSEKVMAQSIPIVGGITGAVINTIFMDHFQKMAYAHFSLRRLERIYSEEIVKEIYTSTDI